MEDDCDLFHETCDCSIGGRSREYARYLEEQNLTHLEDHVAMQELGARGQQTCEGRPSMVSYEDGQEGWAVRKGMEFMAECAGRQEPFFLHVSLPKPHQCYTPAQEFWNLYDESKLTLPPNAEYDMSLKAPHLRGESGEVRTIGVTEFAWSKSVRKGKYRYVYYAPEMFPDEYPGGFGELYDLEDDPWEMKNLWPDPNYAHVVNELRSDLLDWMITTTRPATLHVPARVDSAQGIERYHHTVNPDGKIHYDWIKEQHGGNYI